MVQFKPVAQSTHNAISFLQTLHEYNIKMGLHPNLRDLLKQAWPITWDQRADIIMIIQRDPVIFNCAVMEVDAWMLETALRCAKHFIEQTP